MNAGRDEFLARLVADFPEVVAGFSAYSSGLLHCEVADFRHATERAMGEGRLWTAERHFRFVEEILAAAGFELRNVLEVSYLEDLALGGWTPTRYRAVEELMPKVLREKLVLHDERWG